MSLKLLYVSGKRHRKGIRMKKYIVKKQSIILILALVAAAMLAGCQKSGETRRENSSPSTFAGTAKSAGQDNGTGSAGTGAEEEGEEGTGELTGASALEVRFGDDGAPFVMQMEDNATAAAIAGYVGTANWRLPIYHYDDYENWEVMQYYDIPSRYEIPSDPETVTAEKAGEVYYSEPNRIILFYQDGEVTGEYTKIGTIEDTEEFKEAVEGNPVLEGWGNKIVLINSME